MEAADRDLLIQQLNKMTKHLIEENSRVEVQVTRDAAGGQGLCCHFDVIMLDLLGVHYAFFMA